MNNLTEKLIVLLILFFMSAPLYPQTAMEAGKASSLGIELGKQRKYDEAIKEFDKALNTYNSTASRVYHNKGWVLELKGDTAGAIAAYEEAMKRNPNQIPTLERAGFLYFQTGRFEEAVGIGERVIGLDPKNQEVIKWLPEAYSMRLKKQRDALLAKQEEEKKKQEEEKAAKAAEEEKKEKEKPPRYIYATFDFMIRTGYYVKDTEKDKGYHYIPTPGAYLDMPEMAHIIVTPSPQYGFDLEFGRPYLGALSPDLIVHTEKLEAFASLGKYSLGIGEMGNHYNDDFAYLDDTNRLLHDFKTGFVFGFEDEDAKMMFRFYPRFLPRDDAKSSGKTLDTDYIKMDYGFKIDSRLNFYSWMSMNDYYYFDHRANLSNYWGAYEFGFGVSLGKYKDISRYITYLTVSLDYTERMYFMDLANDKPYKIGNGQGWFGLNSGKWFKGDPFSGFYTDGHVVTAKVEEGITDHIFLYQKLMVELTGGAGDHDEYNLIFGIGGTY